jgi:uncharacterized protein YodC (DUF2158 family)
MPSKFKVGEVVRLKSGGHKMVVCGIRPDSAVECQWQDHNGTNQSDTFSESVLEKPGSPTAPMGYIPKMV